MVNNTVLSGYHGSNGPLKVSDSNLTSTVSYFLEATKQMGYSERDINGESQYGRSNMADLLILRGT